MVAEGQGVLNTARDVRIVEPRAVTDGMIPPHDLDAEAAVVSSILVDAKGLDRVAFLEPDHFFSEAHRRIFEAARAVHAKGVAVDVTTVGSELKATGRIAQAGGMTYVTEVMAAAPYVANVAAYGRTVHALARVRRLIGACQQSAAEGYVEHGEHEEFITGVHRAIEEIARQGHHEAIERNVDTMKRLVKQISETSRKRSSGQLADGVTGIPTGIAGLDALTHGWHGSQVTVIAARMGVGKTALGMQFASHAARLGIGVGVFSLEMTRDELLERELSRVSGVDSGLVKTGDLGMSEWQKLQRAASELSTMPLRIDDSAPMHIDEMTSRALAMIDDAQKSEHPIGMFLVDYVQFMQTPQRLSRERRDVQVGESIKGLKLLAKKTKLPVIVIAQLNRQVDQKTGQVRWPRESDIADSDVIPRTADNILFIHRNAKIEGDEGAEVFTDEDRAVLILQKQRGGKKGVVHTRFNGSTSSFSDALEEYRQ